VKSYAAANQILGSRKISPAIRNQSMSQSAGFGKKAQLIGPAVTLHANRPGISLGAIGFTGGAGARVLFLTTSPERGESREHQAQHGGTA
jgi:hypothetical protein